MVLGRLFNHCIIVLSNITTEVLLWLDFLEGHGCAFALGAGELVTPTALREEVLQDVHGSTMAAHLSEDNIMARLREKCYLPGRYNDVKKWCQSCSKCAKRKPANPKRRLPLQSVLVGYPMQLVAVDILGPFSESPKGNTYLLVVGGYFTRGWKPTLSKTRKHPP